MPIGMIVADLVSIPSLSGYEEGFPPRILSYYMCLDIGTRLPKG
jgi:hypothetical protein